MTGMRHLVDFAPDTSVGRGNRSRIDAQIEQGGLDGPAALEFEVLGRCHDALSG